MVIVAIRRPVGSLVGRAAEVGALGDFFAMTLDVRVHVQAPFAWREYLLQCWFKWRKIIDAA